jgi:hypothetical protein
MKNLLSFLRKNLNSFFPRNAFMAPFAVTCCFSLCMVVTRYAASILCFPSYPIAEPSLNDPQIALSVDG